MTEKSKSKLPAIAGSEKRIVLISAFLVLVNFSSLVPQNTNYWDNATTGKTKIFTISFTDTENGIAESAEGDVLTTTDGGDNWSVKYFKSISEKSITQSLWEADIYCAIMRTTDGGLTWLPYDEEKQDHFCNVYLKDENTNYQVASNFLNKVTDEIKTYSQNNRLDSLLNHPKKCTEYYRNPTEGWAVGWCIRNYSKSNK